MGTTYRHPLRAAEDMLKRALLAEGFRLVDDGRTRELQESEWGFAAWRGAGPEEGAPLSVEDEGWQLRATLLPALLPRFAGEPGCAFAVGRVYDACDEAHPCRTRIEGVLACGDPVAAQVAAAWERIARLAFGIEAAGEVRALGDGAFAVEAQVGGAVFSLARIVRPSAPARSLLGMASDEERALFSIDVDEVACGFFGLAGRDELYSPIMGALRRVEDASATVGDAHRAHAADLLRARGFCEFSGQKLYEEGCYRKMNMIQESWDANNDGVRLARPLGEATGLPTVLTPALEEALAANWRAGEAECRIFEFGHIFLPGKGGAAPSEKLSLSIGAYGGGIDKRSWKAFVDGFLADLGIRNHFFIPTDRAIAYDTSDCWLVMDERMRYLDGNFGTISPKARTNHGIGAPAFMAQFEFESLERKIEEELAFVPRDYE